MRALAPDGEGSIEITIIRSSPSGLCIVEDGDGKRFARHRDRLQPLNADAAAALNAGDTR